MLYICNGLVDVAVRDWWAKSYLLLCFGHAHNLYSQCSNSWSHRGHATGSIATKDIPRQQKRAILFRVTYVAKPNISITSTVEISLIL